MESIKAVIFDLGRVLVDVNIQRLQRFFLEQTAAHDSQEALGRIMTNPVMAQYSRGQVDSRQFHRTLCSQYDLKLSFEEFAACWCDIFSPMKGMEDIVEALSKKVKLGLLSDTDPLHWEHIQSHYPLMGYFIRPTLSFQVGMTKPAKGIYLAAAKNTGAEPSACLFIDDLADNVNGAVMAGMKAIQFKGAGPLSEELGKVGLL